MSSPAAPARRRAALSTVPRGARGLAHFRAGGAELFAIGTAVARGGSEVRVLARDSSGELRAAGAYAADAEVWGIEFPAGGEVAAVATRVAAASAFELWAWREGLAGSGVVDATARGNVECLAKAPIAGKVLSVAVARESAAEMLAVSSTGVSVWAADTGVHSLQQTSAALRRVEGADAGESVVAGGWMSDAGVFVADQSGVALCDLRTGAAVSAMTAREAVASCAPSFLPASPFAARISAACAAGPAAPSVVYVGAEDGSVRAWDVRKRAVLWHMRDAHSHWVSSMAACASGAVLTGGTDGVVRCFAVDGTGAGTFPQHDDTVTCLAWTDESFASVSYDGRVAVNPIPVGAVRLYES